MADSKTTASATTASAASPIAVTLVGATGLTGSAAVHSFLASPTAFAVTALTRRAMPASSSADANPATTYHNRVGDLVPAPKGIASPGAVYVSCLGTTRAAAGGLEAQRKIDVDMNRDLAQQARDDGADTIILVSSQGANAASMFPYLRLKGELEDMVRGMGFTRTVILRPGTLLYDGDRNVKRTAESMWVSLLKGARAMSIPLPVSAVDAEDVGAAIAQLAANPPKDATLYDADISKLANEFRTAQNKANH